MLNLNVGILGHVDSGKTCLAKILSKTASTAAFDKNPQSQERGITLDLGFSSFIIPAPSHLKRELQEECIQFTLVDCPGHASLIKTIIGGAQIIDMMLLVIDVTKGVQTQTAECIVIGELTCKKMLVVLNKIDQLSLDQRTHFIAKMTKKLQTVLSSTIFRDSMCVAIAANPDNSEPLGIDDLIVKMSEYAFIPQRNSKAPFLFFVDHCFGIKGQGTVMTGTILQGSIQINDTLQIPALNLIKKVKSIQMFRKPVQEAKQGDRIGICVTQFDPKLFERGIICVPDLTIKSNAVIIRAQKINYFKFPIKTRSKFHITMGHETIMATITCFCINLENVTSNDTFNFDLEYKYCEQLTEKEDNEEKNSLCNYILLEFDKPVLILPNCLVIGSKLDLDISGSVCRLAFWGTVLVATKEKNYKTTFLPEIKIFKIKKKEGIVERIVNNNEIIVKNMFKKASIQHFLGLKVNLCTGEEGRIESQFGQSGKIKVYIQNGLNAETVEQLQSTQKKTKDSSNAGNSEPIKVMLQFKRYIYDSHKKIIQ